MSSFIKRVAGRIIVGPSLSMITVPLVPNSLFLNYGQFSSNVYYNLQACQTHEKEPFSLQAQNRSGGLAAGTIPRTAFSGPTINMDPISAVGIALSVAGLAGQIFMGCIQCIQFILTAKELHKDMSYMNLRLRLEEQRLFAWGETSGLLDYDSKNNQKVLESNAFGLNRSTVLELLVQIKVLFEDFQNHQIRHNKLETAAEDPHELPPSYEKSTQLDADNDATEGLVPVSPRRKRYIAKAVEAWRLTSKEAPKRLRWAAFDKDKFGQLIERFSALNDSMTGLLDKRLQDEIYSTTQDTNRGVLQLHHDLVDLQMLVKATLVLTLQSQGLRAPSLVGKPEKDNVKGLELLAQLARFKAFNESIETGNPLDNANFEDLQLGNPGAEKVAMEIDRSRIRVITPFSGEYQTGRCEALYKHADGVKRVWVEWKEYDWESPGRPCPAPLIIERAQKLAALLHHTPKPKHFRVPHCLGYFDNAEHSSSDNDDDDDDDEEDGAKSPRDDDNDYRIGFVFEKPPDVPPNTVSVSLLELLQHARRPRVTDRIALAKAIANCILYLHSVNWLHKGLRSANIVFFPSGAISPSPSNPTVDSVSPPSAPSEAARRVDYSAPYISGFDFARPARPDEQTEIPDHDAAHDLYRHPATQSHGLSGGSREGYRKAFDVYSLGVVLVELAHWRPIEEILKIDVRKARARPKVAAGVRGLLLGGEQMGEVGECMGAVFEGVVRRCVQGGEDMGESSGWYNEEVVKRLEGIYV